VPEPVVVPRADHVISRRNIDSDALRVLYRLHEHRYQAYLVGGSVRDLLLGRRPKDFDVGTDAHPYQIKRLFRNCWIIGRRFRLAHVKFGTKTIEVATFRKNVPDTPPDAPVDGAETPIVVASAAPPDPQSPVGPIDPGNAEADGDASMIHRDNTFGTPEEDAFRRDFTINGLFYDIATHSVIDYVGGLGDLERRLLRSIGDPMVRFVEDPVRMFRAAVFSARLGFDLDDLVLEAIAEHRGLIQKASPARLLEEYYKILRSGCAEACFRTLNKLRLLELMTPELKSPPEALWESLSRLDRYRLQFPSAPPQLNNALLIGSILVPLGALNRRHEAAAGGDPRFERVTFGMLPIAKKDLERLRQVTQLLPRMLDPDPSPRMTRSFPHRPAFDDALVSLELTGDAPEALERWTQAKAARGERPHGHAHGQPRGDHRHGQTRGGPDAQPPQDGAASPDGAPRRKRRRRRRGRGRGGASGNV
jgi:poly(A) polymerase